MIICPWIDLNSSNNLQKLLFVSNISSVSPGVTSLSGHQISNWDNKGFILLESITDYDYSIKKLVWINENIDTI